MVEKKQVREITSAPKPLHSMCRPAINRDSVLRTALRVAKPILISALITTAALFPSAATTQKTSNVNQVSGTDIISSQRYQTNPKEYNATVHDKQVSAKKQDWKKLKVVKTQNWAGYVAFSNTKNPEPEVTSVTGTWKVPLVWVQCGWKFPDHPVKWSFAFSSQWIGIGGHFQGDHTLIQIGTVSNFYFGKDAHYIFYEVIPTSQNSKQNGAVILDNFNVRSEDVIRASIKLVNDKENEYRLSVRDLTEHEKFSTTIKYKSSRLSAEWIEERPFGSMFGVMLQTPLPGFNAINFVDLNKEDSNYATIGGISGPISMFHKQMLNIWEYEDGAYKAPAHESAVTTKLDPNGRGFSIYKLDCTDSN